MIQQPICIDDFGTAIYHCRFTGALVGGSSAMICGPIVPGVKAVYIMGASVEAKKKKLESDHAFHESEANCNTCTNLRRVTHDSIKGGFLVAQCGNPDRVPTPYPERAAGLMMFHPSDPMLMPCYFPRWGIEQSQRALIATH